MQQQNFAPEPRGGHRKGIFCKFYILLEYCNLRELPDSSETRKRAKRCVKSPEPTCFVARKGQSNSKTWCVKFDDSTSEVANLPTPNGSKPCLMSYVSAWRTRKVVRIFPAVSLPFPTNKVPPKSRTNDSSGALRNRLIARCIAYFKVTVTTLSASVTSTLSSRSNQPRAR